MLQTATPDRRAALKAKHRQAILDAAQELVDEHDGRTFSVEELAERADVARRTVFNHFASIDEILLSLCAHALEVLIDDFVGVVAAAPLGDGSRSSMFDEIAQSLRSADLPGAIAMIARILGEPDDIDDPRGRALSDEAFARAADRLQTEVKGRHPDADSLEIAFLVGALMSGVIVIARHWILETGVRLDDEGRAAWQALLSRLIDSVRSGYDAAP
ncbi:TetR/AcrR family transcriptional regulator [Frondihabitans peucedani]|uniref:HTH tetR-type domain-containing protein n=1 Tax=Frondihabitans peucedani TaxID=598626 RepID=A0ABP8DZ82_9MICO